jgi:hypothetical protein
MKTWIEKLKAATLLRLDKSAYTGFVPLDGGLEFFLKD